MKIEKEIILAPMAGYTNSAFRRLCKLIGADRVYSELMNPMCIIHRDPPRKLAFFKEEERPIHMQVYGRNAEEISEAALILCRKYKPDTIDINFGCPAKKVVKSKAGGYLLKKPREIRKIIEATVAAVKPYNIPVSAKIRLGFHEDNLEEIAENILIAGASAIALHARTVSQGFSGNAQWNRVKRLKELAGNVPVIGNGDIKTWRDVYIKFKETACNGVMVGRIALSNPWIFKEFKEKRDIKKSISEKVDFILRQISMMWEFMEKEKACREIKSQVIKIFKGEKNKKTIKRKIATSRNCHELMQALYDI